jgi:hypothetical protein
VWQDRLYAIASEAFNAGFASPLSGNWRSFHRRISSIDRQDTKTPPAGFRLAALEFSDSKSFSL